MKTQLNMWVYEEDATAIRAKAERADMRIGEYVTRTVLGRDPTHPPSLEDRVVAIEQQLGDYCANPECPVHACTCDPAIGEPFSAYRVEREIDYDCPQHGAAVAKSEKEN